MSAGQSLCEVFQLGLVPYLQAWRLQARLAAEIAAGSRQPTLLLLEHSHVYTLGRRGQTSNILWTQQELADRNVEVHRVDRGGDVTYHGPGQLVGYPLLNVGRLDPSQRLPQADFLGYLRSLEQVIIQALARFDLSAMRLAGKTGVWIDPQSRRENDERLPEGRKKPAKIAAIGVKVDSHGISRHGFALNVRPEMDYWHGLVACGLVGFECISMQDLIQPPPSMGQVSGAILDAFADVFSLELIQPTAGTL